MKSEDHKHLAILSIVLDLHWFRLQIRQLYQLRAHVSGTCHGTSYGIYQQQRASDWVIRTANYCGIDLHEAVTPDLAAGEKVQNIII